MSSAVIAPQRAAARRLGQHPVTGQISSTRSTIAPRHDNRADRGVALLRVRQQHHSRGEILIHRKILARALLHEAPTVGAPRTAATRLTERGDAVDQVRAMLSLVHRPTGAVFFGNQRVYEPYS